MTFMDNLEWKYQCLLVNCLGLIVICVGLSDQAKWCSIAVT